MRQQALDAGKPVLVEEAFRDDGRRAPARDRARATQAALLRGGDVDALPPACKCRAKQLLAEGAIGEAQTLIADFTSPVDLGGDANRFVDPALGGAVRCSIEERLLFVAGVSPARTTVADRERRRADREGRRPALGDPVALPLGDDGAALVVARQPGQQRSRHHGDHGHRCV